METDTVSGAALASAITRTASKHTYYTVRLLADRHLVDDAYRAYACFRWVDDSLDQGELPQVKRMAFVQRQRALMDAGYRRQRITQLSPHERLLVELIEVDTEDGSGLQAYIRTMMAVMEFDAVRRGRLVSQGELRECTHGLAVAVTEALHYFIGGNCASANDEKRYPPRRLTSHNAPRRRGRCESRLLQPPGRGGCRANIDPTEVGTSVYRNWVKETVHEARACLRAGRHYLNGASNLRCRIAGYAYIRPAEYVLDCIEREGNLLRADYREQRGYRRGLEMIVWALSMALSRRHRVRA